MLFLFIYLFNLYIRPQDWFAPLYGWPVDYLIIIPALIFGFIGIFSDKKKLIKTPHYVLLILLLLVIFLSNAIHGNFGFGFDQTMLFLKKVCVFIIVLLIVKSTTKLKSTLFLINIFCSVIAIQAILQFFSGGTGLAGQGFYHPGIDNVSSRTQWVGLFSGANSTALIFNLAIALCLEFSFGPYSLFWRILNMVFASCLIFGVYTTNSRGGFLTLAAVIVTFFLLKMKNKKVAVITSFLLCLSLLIYLAPGRMGMLNTQEESAYIRTRLWGNAMDWFKENPLLGIGKGQFELQSSRSLVAHSNFMQNLSEIGGIGIFVWVALIYFAFKGLFLIYSRKVTNRKEDDIKSLTRALLVSFIGFNVCTLFITMETEVLYLLLGVSVAIMNIYNREIKTFNLKFTFKDLGGILVSIFGLLLYYHFYTR